nr:MAG: hypothetical protein KatS3mg041_0001 [Bacteroidota bacterium]
MRFLLFGLALTLVGLLLDVYVYRRWRRFVREAGWPEFGYRLYAVLIPLAALLMPLYILLWRFWEVEPRLPRAILSGLWVLWYLPKLFLAPVLLLAQGASLLEPASEEVFVGLSGFGTGGAEALSAHGRLGAGRGAVCADRSRADPGYVCRYALSGDRVSAHLTPGL